MRSIFHRLGLRLVAALLLAGIQAFFAGALLCGQESGKQGSTNSIRLTIVGPDGEGVAECPVRLTGRMGRTRLDKRSETAKDGSVTFEYGDGKINNLRLSIRQPGYVPVHYSWDSDNTDISLPPELTVELEHGREIRGRVVDENEQPIENASVRLSMPITWPQRDSYYFGLATLKTDSDGRWRFADAPKNLARVSVRVSHPDFKQGYSSAKSDITTIELDRGISLPGQVLDSEGKPVSGAVARLGPDRWGTNEPEARSDAEGKFELKNCEPGKNVLTVQAAGFAPQIVDVDVQAGSNQAVEIRLDSPHQLKIRVVDINGDPVPNATFAVDGWRGYRTLAYRGRTNANGEATWDSAPPDALVCDILCPGFMAGRDTTCVPGDKVNVVTLYPKLEITGRVIDRAGEKPVASFRMIRGQNQSNLGETYWRTDESHEFSNGRYKFTFDEPVKSWQLKVIADGYQPKVSREFKSTEGQVRYSFLLERAAQLKGRVVDAKGDPVEGAKVIVASSGSDVSIRNGYLDERESAAKPVLSQPKGDFTVTLPDQGFYLLIAIHDKGFVELAKPDVAENQTLRLQPWSRISGVSMLGEFPDAERDIHYAAKRPRDGRSYGMVEYQYGTSTDANGAFELQRVIAGEGSVSRVLVVEYGTGSLHSPGWQVPVEVTPGSEQKVQIGGAGFLVTGTLALGSEPPSGTNWQFEPSLSLAACDEKTGDRIEPYISYSGAVRKDGSFEIHDVPAGYYQVRSEVQVLGAQNRIAGRLGTLLTHVSVSETASDVGKLVIPLEDTLDPGETMPTFVVETLQGQILDSRRLRKVVVFVNFWSTYSKESMGETAQLKSILESIGDDRQVVFLSLGTAAQIEAAWEEIETRGWDEHQLPWLHAHAGPRYATTCQSFCLKKVPANFLFAPDGKLVAKNIPTQEIAAKIEELLKVANFDAEQAAPEIRFPVKRFAEGPPTKTRGADHPTVFVVSDADLNDELKQDQDSLIAFDEDLNERWRLELSRIDPGSAHKLLLDRHRNRLYVCQTGARKLLAFDLQGNRIWEVSNIDASCGTIDTQTGNIWLSGGAITTFGDTVVLDPNGKELLALPYRAVDMIYHPTAGTIWLAGKHLIIVNRDGALISRNRVSGHRYQSISHDPKSGKVWIAERDHPDVEGSINQILVFSPDGEKETEIRLGQLDPYAIECVTGGKALFGGYNSGLQAALTDGDRKQLLPGVKRLEAPKELSTEQENGYRIQSISVSQKVEDRVWVVTPKSLLRLDNLQVTARTELSAEYSATVVAF